MGELMLSVIIPVYNCEKYLRRCLESVLYKQSFREFEVILIDDGSADRSAEICDEYAQNDARVSVIRQENGGASSARNAGLDAAAGRYILFVDADDYIEEDSLRKIIEVIELDGDCDILMLNAVSVLPDGTIEPGNTYKKEKFFNLPKETVLNNLPGGLPDCLWDKLIRRELIEKNRLRFTEGIICEDFDFLAELFLRAETFNAVGEGGYYCYSKGRAGSVMNTKSDKHFKSMLFILEKWGARKEYASVINNWIAPMFCWVLIPAFASISKDAKREYKTRITRFGWLLKHLTGWRTFAIRMCFTLFGLNFTAAMLNSYYRMRQKV